jgi:N-acetylmuramoyl-L-alanine amidase
MEAAIAGVGWAAAIRGRRVSGKGSLKSAEIRPERVATRSKPESKRRSALRLDGKVVGIDPGHNGDNWTTPQTCDSTGTESASGYAESLFNFNVAMALAANLRATGAAVVLTRTTNSGIGPCVTRRAAIANDAHADVAVSIHADSGPTGGRGFSILEPVASGINDAVVTPSQALGVCVRSAFLSETTMPVSDYYGADGIVLRDDLGGLNLTTVPKVIVECGNMKNETDAALIASPTYQQQVADALTKAISAFLTADSRSPRKTLWSQRRLTKPREGERECMYNAANDGGATANGISAPRQGFVCSGGCPCR